MEKPQWKDIEDWVKYIAMDNNGVYWKYSARPKFDGHRWVGSGRCQCSYDKDDIKKAKDSLEKRPVK